MIFYVIGAILILGALYFLGKREQPTFLRIGVLIPLIVGVFFLTYPKQQEMADKNNNKTLSEAKKIASCKLIEENINNGLFQENTNKLDCNGVIKNIPVGKYDEYISIANGDR